MLWSKQRELNSLIKILIPQQYKSDRKKAFSFLSRISMLPVDLVVFSFIFQLWNPSEINQFALVFVVNEKWTRLIHSQSHISKGLNPGHMIQERHKVETRSNCDTKLCFFAVISGGILSLNITKCVYIFYPRGHLSCNFGRFSSCSKVKYDFGLWICASTE